MSEEPKTERSPEELTELALRGEPDRFERPELLKQAHAALEKAGRSDDARRLVPVIFALHMHPLGPDSPRFTPFMTGTTEEGEPWGWPDLAVLTDDDWDVIRDAVSDSHPEVTARCADLVWENKREFPTAVAAFENYLTCTRIYFAHDWMPELADALGRAGALAGYAKHHNWAERVAAEAWALVARSESEGNRTATKRILGVLLKAWGVLAESVDFDAILRRLQVLHASAVADGEDLFTQQSYLTQMHEAASRAGDDAARDATTRALIECLRKQALERESTGSAMVAATFIEQALRWGERAGVSGSQMEALKAELQRLHAASGDESLELRATGEVPREVLERLLNPYRGRPSSEMLGLLTQDHNLLPSHADCIDLGQEKLRESVTSLFEVHIFHGDYKVAALHTDEERLEHATLEAASMISQMASLMLLDPVFALMEEQDPDWPRALNDYFADVPWLRQWRLPLMDVAIERIRADDYVSAMHILVFWVEGCLRDMLAAANVLVIDLGGGVRLLSTLLEVARRVNGIDPNLVFFIEALLCKPLGSNLRNLTGHALLEPDQFNRKNTLLILLAAIRLGSYRLEPKGGEPGAAL